MILLKLKHFPVVRTFVLFVWIINKNYLLLIFNRALCELRLGKFQLAREDAEDAMDLEPNQVILLSRIQINFNFTKQFPLSAEKVTLVNFTKVFSNSNMGMYFFKNNLSNIKLKFLVCKVYFSHPESNSDRIPAFTNRTTCKYPNIIYPICSFHIFFVLFNNIIYIYTVLSSLLPSGNLETFQLMKKLLPIQMEKTNSWKWFCFVLGEIQSDLVRGLVQSFALQRGLNCLPSR